MDENSGYEKREVAKTAPTCTIDVTHRELFHLQLFKDGAIRLLNKLLYGMWVGKHKSRAHSVRVGSINVFRDKDDCLHMDFSTRFSIPDDMWKKIESAIGDELNAFAYDLAKKGLEAISAENEEG